MSICLICQSDLPVSSWDTVFSLKPPKQLCDSCHEMLKLIKGELCAICGRPLDAVPKEYQQNGVCNDCLRWEKNEHWCGILKKNVSVYYYNSFMKEILSYYKFRGDYQLAYAFKDDFIQCFRTNYSGSYVIIPIPLSEERLYERGFNQAEVFARFLSSQTASLLSRVHLEKQSKKSRDERLAAKNMFTVIDKEAIHNRDILLIDDIYTTGTTLRIAAKCLLQEKARSVSSLTLIRG